MVGQQQTVLPLLAEEEFDLTGYTFIFTYVAAFGLTKAAANYAAGTWADRYGRKPVLIAGWLVAVPVPLLLIWAPNWGWVIAANVLLGINQGADLVHDRHHEDRSRRSRVWLVACWWARLTVESTLTAQSTCPAVSASASNSAWIRSQVPSPLNLRCRFHTVCHGPNSAGRSRHGDPVRNRHTIPSTTRR